MGAPKGKPHKSRGGRPPRLYEALERAWEAIQGKKIVLDDITFIEATLRYERERRAKRGAARLRAGKNGPVTGA